MAIIKNPLTLIKGGTGTLIEKSITENGTYNAQDDNADGYSEVTVNVAGGGSEINPPFADTRCIKVPLTGLYRGERISHYLVCGPYNSGAGGYTIGNTFCVYDITSKQIIHRNPTSYGGYAVYLINKITDTKYMVQIGQFGYRAVPALWILETATDTWTFLEGSDVPSTLDWAIRYSHVNFAGEDFCCFKGDTDTSRNTLIKPDNTFLRFHDTGYANNYVETRDSEYVYRTYNGNGNASTYYNAGNYTVVRSAIATPNKYYDVKQYNMGTSSASKRFAYQCGRIVLFTGIFNTSRSWSLVDMGKEVPSPINIYPSINDVYANQYVYDAVHNVAYFFRNNNFVFMVNIAGYLNGETSSQYCKYITQQQLSYNNCKVINGRVFVTANSNNTQYAASGLYEVDFTNGLTLRVETPAVSFGIHGTPNPNDLLIIPSSSQTNQSNFAMHIYHLNTDTSTNLVPNADINGIYLSINTSANPNNAFTENAITNVYHTPQVQSGTIIYNSLLDRYYVLKGSQWSATSSYYKVVKNKYIYGRCYSVEGIGISNYWNPVLVTSDGFYYIDVNIPTNSSIVQPFGCYSYNDKDYFCFAKTDSTNNYHTVMLCYDTVNKTFVVHSDLSTSYTVIGINFGQDAYPPVVCYNKVFFTYQQMKNNGQTLTTVQLTTTSFSLIFDQTNETWTADNTNNNRFITVADVTVGNKIVCRSNTGNSNLKVYDVENDIETTISEVPANTGSWKLMPNGKIIIKTTTNLYKYDVATGTSETLATGTNNSNSNNYGYVYACQNACIVATIIAGAYNSNNDTYKTISSNTNYYSSNYSKSMQLLNHDVVLFRCFRSSSNVTSYNGWCKLSNIENISILQNSYTLQFYYTDDYLYSYYESVASGSVYYTTMYVYKYDLETLESIASYQRNINFTQSSSYLPNIKTQDVENGTTFAWNNYIYLYFDFNTETFYVGYQPTYLIGTDLSTYGLHATIPKLRKSYVFLFDANHIIPAAVYRLGNYDKIFSNLAAPVCMLDNATYFIGKWEYSQEELEGE